MAESKTTIDNIKLISFIVSILGIGITIGVFSQKLNVVEANVAAQQIKIEQINDINTHLATIDLNISSLSKALLKYDITVAR